MKRFIIIAVVLVFVFVNSAFAQLLSIQGVARNSEGQSLADKSYTFTFRLYEHLTDGLPGDAKWTENQSLVVKNGVFSANLGSTPSGSMSNLDFNTEYWLSIEIGGNGEMTPRSKLTLTPYAAVSQINGISNIFTQDANVGIGTTTPAFKLDVKGTTAISKIATSGDEDAIRIGVDGEYGAAIKLYDDDDELNQSFSIFYSAATQDLSFKSHSTDNILYLDYAGNVGIGTNDPDQALEIVKSNANTRLRIDRTTNAYEGFLEFSTADAGKWLVGVDNNDDDFRIYTYEGAGTVLTIDGVTGNVGIDDTSPGALLDVNGDVFVKGSKPIEVRTYTKDNDETNSWDTGYNINDWSAMVVGYDYGNCDVDEGGAEGSWKVLMIKNTVPSRLEWVDII
ncbi:hypothetical protein KJ762_09685 [bacterium]|nr:hypothetical protein [bacterium]MBU1634764.1 hypothetical protein [bacterium]MBU1873728.1 hypothetical protein [bacterium]